MFIHDPDNMYLYKIIQLENRYANIVQIIVKADLYLVEDNQTHLREH